MAQPPAAPRLPLAALAVSTATVIHTLAFYLPTLNTPRTAIAGVPHARSAHPVSPPLARRLAVVVLDGLSFDAARALPELAPLRARGALRSLAVDFPSFTSPAILSFMTGLGPRDSGTRLNGHLNGVAGLDSIARAAADARVPVTVLARGYDDFPRLVDPQPGARVYPGYFAPIVELVRRDLGAPSRGIDLFHFGLVDDMGHAHGARSRQYADAARDRAVLALRVAASLDLERDALVVLSDHGHLATGGHGGAEPEVRHALFLGVGAPFHRGVELGERRMRDVAPTLAVVAGVRAPTSSLGLPMIDALTAAASAAAPALAAPFDQAVRFSCAVAPSPRCAEAAAVAARLAAKDVAALADAEALHADLSATLDRALEARRDGGARKRLAVVATLLALALWAWRVVARRVPEARALALAAALPAVNLATYLAYFGGLGYRPGFTYLRAAPLLIRDAIPGALLAVAASALAARRLRTGPVGPWVLLLGSAIPFALLAAWVGADPTATPPSIAGAAVFQTAPAVLSAALGACLAAALERRRGRAVA